MERNKPDAPKVDVLAVMDEAISKHEYHFGTGTCHGKAMREARASVAELIEAARGFDKARYEGGQAPNSHASIRLRAALANIGPQS